MRVQIWLIKMEPRFENFNFEPVSSIESPAVFWPTVILDSNVPEYTFRVFVTSLSLPPEEVWREYNRRADMEKRIGELTYDLAADDFCMRGFFHTEAAFRGILFLFNLLSEFQRVAGMTTYRQPATLRSGVFLCGAVMGSIGRYVALHLASGWGGLQTRNHLFDNILAYVFPASPKLAPVAADG